jgi:hypothetical protein
VHAVRFLGLHRSHPSATATRLAGLNLTLVGPHATDTQAARRDSTGWAADVLQIRPAGHAEQTMRSRIDSAFAASSGMFSFAIAFRLGLAAPIAFASSAPRADLKKPAIATMPYGKAHAEAALTINGRVSGSVSRSLIEDGPPLTACAFDLFAPTGMGEALIAAGEPKQNGALTTTDSRNTTNPLGFPPWRNHAQRK